MIRCAATYPAIPLSELKTQFKDLYDLVPRGLVTPRVNTSQVLHLAILVHNTNMPLTILADFSHHTVLVS